MSDVTAIWQREILEGEIFWGGGFGFLYLPCQICKYGVRREKDFLKKERETKLVTFCIKR